MARSRSIPQAPAPGTEEIRTLALADITREDILYAREHTNYSTVWEYLAFYEEDVARLPPLDVFVIGGQYVLSDGFHRYDAAHKAGLTTLPCRIFTGTARDAYLHAVEVNGRQHGLAYNAG